MFGLTILDLALIVTLLSYLIHGLRNGFLVTLGGIAGFAAGAVAAFVSVPIVSGLVEDSGWRLTAIVATAVLLMVLGHGAGHHDRAQDPQRGQDQPAAGGGPPGRRRRERGGVRPGDVDAGLQHRRAGRALRVPAARRVQSDPLHRRRDADAGQDVDGAAALRGDRRGHSHPVRGLRPGPARGHPGHQHRHPGAEQGRGVGPEDRRNRLPVRPEPDRNRFRGRPPAGW